MKPIKIDIVGLNSFREKVSINFEELSSRWIFGIFGNTGSGKSTILDAMTFALYGVIARYGGKSYGNCINENEQEARVEFEFAINDTCEHRYIVTRSIKRKKTGEYYSAVAKLVDITQKENFAVISDKAKEVTKAVEKIIGLTYEDFIKTVVLPQGGFKEFLVLENADRRSILQRIFGLEKYGDKLEAAARDRQKDTEEKIIVLRGEIAGIGEDITEESVEKQKDELKCAKKELSELKKEGLVKKELAKGAESIIEIRKKLRKFKYDRMLLEEKSFEIEDLKNKQMESEKAERVCPIIKNYRMLLDQAYNSTIEINRAQKQLEEASTSAKEKKKLYEESKNNYDANYVKGMVKKEKLEASVSAWENYSKLLECIDEKQIEYNKLIIEKTSSEERKDKLNVLKKEKERELESVDEKIFNLRKSIEEEAKLVKALNLYEISKKIKTEIINLENEAGDRQTLAEKALLTKKEKEKELLKLKITEKQFSIEKIKNSLKKGETCPVCGHLIEDEIVALEAMTNGKEFQIEEEIANLETEILNCKSKIETESVLIEKAKDCIINNETELKEKEAELIELYPPERHEHLKKDIVEINSNKKELVICEEKLAKLKDEIKNDETQILKINDSIGTAETEIGILKTEISSIKDKKIEFENMLIETVGEIKNPKEELLSLEKSLKKVQEDLNKAQKEKNNSEAFETEAKEKYTKLKSKLETIHNQFKAKKDELCKALEKYYGVSFEDLDEKRKTDFISIKNEEILNQLLEEKEFGENKTIIENYLKEVASIKAKIEELEIEEKGDLRTDAELIEIIAENENLLKKLEDVTKHLNIAESKVERDESALKKKKIKVEKLEELERRNILIKDLRELVGSKRFAEYMAIEQLKYITFTATKTLSYITNGQYSLEADEIGNFKIRDFKNGGALRDVKTMSGGETFIVSLSLALALSKQLQLKGGAKIELFFLDEGFGTLDEGLLDVVMDSLEKLASDKFRIGIISHVDQLKQRMPMRLEVKAAKAGGIGSSVSIFKG